MDQFGSNYPPYEADEYLPPDYDIEDDTTDYSYPSTHHIDLRHFRQMRMTSGGQNIATSASNPRLHNDSLLDSEEANTMDYEETGYKTLDEELDKRTKETMFPDVSVRKMPPAVSPKPIHRNIIEEERHANSLPSDDMNDIDVSSSVDGESALPVSFKDLYTNMRRKQPNVEDRADNFTDHVDVNMQEQLQDLRSNKGTPPVARNTKRGKKKDKHRQKPEELELKELGYVNKGASFDSADETPEIPSSPPPEIVVQEVPTFKCARRPPRENAIEQSSPTPQLKAESSAKGIHGKGAKQKTHAAHLTFDNLVETDDPEIGECLDEMMRVHRQRSFRGRSRKRSRRRSHPDNGNLLLDSPSGENYKQMYRKGGGISSESELLEHLRLQKEIIDNIRKEPWRMKKKLKTLRLAKAFVEKYEGHLSTGKGYQEAGAKYWRRIKREFSNFVSVLVPWEMRIKKIESHFGSVVSSYFTFLRWLLWVNIVLTCITMGFIVIPEILVGADFGSVPGKTIPKAEKEDALNFNSILDFEGYLEYSPLFYGYYGAEEEIGNGYKLPLAYFLAGLATFGVSFVILLRKMAKNSRTSKMASKDEQFTFSWKVFNSWDFMIGIPETAKNKSAEIVTNFKEAILEAQEKEREENMKLLIFLRVVANILVLAVLAGSAYAIQICVTRSEKFEEMKRNGESISAWESMELSTVMTLITSLFPSIFDLIGLMEKFHPRVNLRWQLARILTLYFLNLYTLLYALVGKISRQQTKLADRNAAILNATLACNSTTIQLQGNGDYHDNTTWTNFTTAAPSDLTTEIYNCSTPAEFSDVICWETMIGQEIFKLAFTDTWMTVLLVVAIDCVRGLFVRFFNPCWCWDLERKFPEYGEFKIAENILHLIYNQATIWLGTFFVPVLPGFNIFKLVILLYCRSWAVLMCNIPHERVFKASRSNNFYYAISLLMLFLVTFAVGFLLVVMSPSTDCGPFRNLGPDGKSYYVLTGALRKDLPGWGDTVMGYIASPGIVIPAFLLTCMGIYYLLSLTRSLKEANKDLREQLLYERTEEKRKIYAMADAKREGENGKTDEKVNKSNPGQQQSQSSAGRRETVESGGQGGRGHGPGVSQPGPSSGRQEQARPRQRSAGRGVRVVKVPGMTMQQAVALKAKNPNVKIMTTEEAARLRLIPPIGPREGRSEGMVVATRGQGRGRPAPTNHNVPPIAVVQGKPLAADG